MAGKNKTVCIVGGGNIGHVLAGVLSYRGYSVNILTSKPQRWSKTISVSDPYGRTFEGKLCEISDEPSKVIKDADLILLCLPGNAIKTALKQIKPYTETSMLIGSIVGSTGFFWMAKSILSTDSKLFAFQRVPYICRLLLYGKSAELKGYKDKLFVGASRNIHRDTIQTLIEELFEIPTEILESYLEAALTNSNPILHPSRLYSVLRDQTGFKTIPKFYEEWNEESSEILIQCDNEFRNIINALNVPSLHKLPALIDYYEASDAKGLAKKIRSIKAFKGIKFPMKEDAFGYVPDYTNRYFLEDIPYGMLIIKSIGDLVNIQPKMISEIITWAQVKMGKEYLINNETKGNDITDSAIVQNYNIHDLQSFINI